MRRDRIGLRDPLALRSAGELQAGTNVGARYEFPHKEWYTLRPLTSVDVDAEPRLPLAQTWAGNLNATEKDPWDSWTEK